MRRGDSREIQKKAEFFAFYVHSPDPKQRQMAWDVGLELYEYFQPLIKKIVLSKTNKLNIDSEVWTSTIKREGIEDMLSEGKVRFFEGLYHYDPSSGVYFCHYIKQKIQYGVFNSLRKQKAFDHSIRTFSVPTFELDRVMEEPEEEEEYKPTTLHLALRVAWNSLNKKQQNVLDLTLFREYTLREAGQKMGLHFTTVRGIKKKSLNQMKKILRKFVATS